MILNKKVKKILYGGDYNPEQWEESVWEEDMRLFRLAHIDTVTLNVFSWATLQPSEERYDFSKLDRIMELVTKNNLNICLATSTAAHPAWMARKYPDVLRTEFNGMKRKFGGRHNSCPNSPTYQKYSVKLAEALAKRYGSYDNIVAWHVSNEFSGECYCENCEKTFRVWLKGRYGTLQALNQAWNTSFWGHTFYDWEEIVAPNILSEHIDYENTMFQGISLDYRRFQSDRMMACYQAEYDAIKKETPDIPITTNLMGFYKLLDYQKWGKYMDFISWDSYPSNQDSVAQMACNHELMRGLKQGLPFALMEQTPSVTNWQSYNYLKRPGVMRLWSYQAVAHGADTVFFFQMRRSIGACEKYHGAVIDHVGTEHTRVFRECTALGAELERLGDEILGSKTKSEAAILFDWDNWWSVEYSAGPTVDLEYQNEMMKFYTALHNANISADIIGNEDDFEPYKLVIAPIFYMNKGDVDQRIRNYVKNGGCFVTTFFSGYVDESDLVIIGGYPGKLRDILGIWVEESDALPSDKTNSFVWEGNSYPANMLCDIIHLEGAVHESSYQEDFYEGVPVITKHAFGKGTACYIGTSSSEAFYDAYAGKLCRELGIEPVLNVPKGVEATKRETKEKEYIFLLNHSEEEKSIVFEENGVELLSQREVTKGETIYLEAKGVAIIKSRK